MKLRATHPPEVPDKLNLAFGAENSPNICWVCGLTTSLEEHHMIPRAYGGQDGPVITLCAGCHSCVHKLADYNAQDLEYAHKLLKTDNKKSLTRLSELAIIIAYSKQATKNDENKTIVFMDRFPASVNRQLKALAKVLKKDQRTIVRLAIAQLYKVYFKQIP